MFDIGTGALANMREHLDYDVIDHVVVSHMHADHFFDLVPLRQGLKYGPLSRRERMPVFLPPGGRDALDALRRAVAPDTAADFFEADFAVSEYDPSPPMDIGDLRLTFAPTRHYIPGFAVRAERNGGSITYSSDTAPCDAVVTLARGGELFLCEASLGLGTEDGERGHSSAEEAGEMASRAGIGQLVLTHYGAGDSPDALVEAARRRFAGPVLAADDGDQFSVFGSSLGSEN